MAELDRLPLGQFFRLYRQIVYITVNESRHRAISNAAASDPSGEIMAGWRTLMMDVIKGEDARAIEDAIEFKRVRDEKKTQGNND
ncbi:hypothetical protein [Limisalsivibrio acetivorans]|uniref:hypothetical protein n=1 Tax=Limisalsivibrio acetivorans TaxID=1304888 RepID=UPI0003B68512|nr:hypothetical protein [Limisalsivibrio acetivorans]